MVAILVVEDDVTTQFVMTEFLETLGYQCHIVSNGKDCIDVLNANPEAFDIVLMDIHMPGMTGVDATRQIRAQLVGKGDVIPIIAITADESYQNLVVLRGLGIDEVLPKPVDLSELDNAILRFAA